MPRSVFGFQLHQIVSMPTLGITIIDNGVENGHSFSILVGFDKKFYCPDNDENTNEHWLVTQKNAIRSFKTMDAAFKVARDIYRSELCKADKIEILPGG